MDRVCDYLKINILKQNSHTLMDNAGKRPGKSIYKATEDVAKLQKYAKCTKMDQIENKVMRITFAKLMFRRVSTPK